jgi:hypothetical protein
MANSTYEQVQNRTYGLLAESDISTQYDADAVDTRIMWRYRDMCSGKITRYYPSARWASLITAKRLPFLEAMTPITFGDSPTLTADVAVWADVIMLDTTFIVNSSWAVYIRGCLITYTNKWVSWLTGCSWIVIPLNESDKVTEVFKISNLNIYKPMTVLYQDWDRQQPIPNLEPWQYEPGTYFKILNYWADKYILFVGCVAWSYRLNYIQTPTVLVNPADEFLLPWDAAYLCIAPIVAGELLREAEEIEFAKEKLEAAYANITQFFNQFNSEIDQRPQQISYGFVSGDDII